MEEKHSSNNNDSPDAGGPRFRLTTNQIAMIEEAIAVVGAYGEITLVVDKHRLHYVTAKKSFNAHNYNPGTIIAEFKTDGS